MSDSFLLDPLLVQAGIISDVASAVDPGIKWFEGISIGFFIQNIILPVILVIIFVYMMKQRYDNKKKRERHRELMYYNSNWS